MNTHKSVVDAIPQGGPKKVHRLEFHLGYFGPTVPMLFFIL
jgi:hypothetical protein